MNNNDIVIIYGYQINENVQKLLEKINLAQIIKNKSAKIVIKPNLVLPQNPKYGATTHTEIIIALIKYLQDKGFYNIKIVESSWIGASTKNGFKENGYYKISEKYNVCLVDVKDDKYIKVKRENITVEMSKEIMDCDFLISVPVLKGHCQTRITCALKNMKGCISDKSKRDFHNLGLMKPIAVLNSIKKADLVIVDSLNGDLDFEEGGNPVKTDRIYAAIDSVLCDAFSASLLGYKINEVLYIQLANELNVGSLDLQNANIINLNSPKGDYSNFKPTRSVIHLARYIEDRSACSACYGNLIHAIKRLTDENEIGELDKICIGQGYKDCNDKNLVGVGNCTKNLGKSLKGCPPSANDMIDFIKNL